MDDKLKEKLCSKCGRVLDVKERHMRYCQNCIQNSESKSKIDKLSRRDFCRIKTLYLRRLF